MIIVKDQVIYEINFEAGELWRVQDRIREERHLTPKAWAVLQRLVEVPPRTIVRKRDLLDKVWGDVQGSEQSLTKVIRELRLALDDDPENPAFIKTAHGRGFLFIGKKDPPEDEGGGSGADSVRSLTEEETVLYGTKPEADKSRFSPDLSPAKPPPSRSDAGEPISKSGAEEILRSLPTVTLETLEGLFFLINLRDVNGNEDNPRRLLRRLQQKLVNSHALPQTMVKQIQDDFQFAIDKYTGSDYGPGHSGYDGYDLCRAMCSASAGNGESVPPLR